jgi:uncharacterized protein (DUF2141 family)
MSRATLLPLQTLLLFLAADGALAEAAAEVQPESVTLRVEVTGFGHKGEVGCGLYQQAEGFPTDPSAAVQTLWQDASGEQVTCVFSDLQAGTYAVTASNDTNGNRIVDTNLFGMPKEAWGVSGDVRPRLRAPRFDEARFQTPLSGELVVKVRVQ